ncbi:MAG: hypothetical protein MJK04_14110, partial [Psychrosphaera sp.]|nr:hypothetical protein [Psychrosphaera sp.]
MNLLNHCYSHKRLQSNRTKQFFVQLLALALVSSTWFVQAGEVFGTFSIDGVPSVNGTVTLYDRNFNATGSTDTNDTGQYRLLYNDPGLYFISGVQGLATTDFIELTLAGGEKNLDLNVLVSNKTMTIKGQVTTSQGYPISFAALQLSTGGFELSKSRFYSDKFGYFEQQLKVPSFAVNLELAVWLGDGLSKLSQNNEELTVLSSKQYFQIAIDKDQLVLDYDVKMPVFNRQTIKLADLNNKPIADVSTTIFHQNNGQLYRLGEYQSDVHGDVNFYYPAIDNDIQTQPTKL